MIGSSIKYLFGLIAILLLGFIAFSIFEDKYLNFGLGNNEPIEVIEKRVNDIAVLEKITGIGKIELVKYQLKDAVEYAKRQSKNSLMPEEKILMVVAGEAVGCVDFTKIGKNDVVFMGDSLLITLPQPELCYYKLNQQDCKIYDISTAKMFDIDKTELIDVAYKKAEKRVERLALQSNILEETKKNAELLLKPLLENLSEKRVFFYYKNAEDSESDKLIEIKPLD